MADYTPTTGEVRDAYVRRRADEKRFFYDSRTRPRARAEFERWLATHDREVAEKAWDEAVDTLSRHWEDVAPAAVADLERRNPYRGSSDCGCDLTGMTPPAVHIVDNHGGGAS